MLVVVTCCRVTWGLRTHERSLESRAVCAFGRESPHLRKPCCSWQEEGSAHKTLKNMKNSVQDFQCRPSWSYARSPIRDGLCAWPILATSLFFPLAFEAVLYPPMNSWMIHAQGSVVRLPRGSSCPV